MRDETPAWWGDTPLELDEVRRWRIGPLWLRAWRRAGEWWLHTKHEGDWREPALEVAAAADRGEIDEAEVVRFAVSTGTVRLEPALPDRAVVVRPERTYQVPPDGKGEVYVSVPLWLQLRLPPIAQPLLDHEIFPNKRTWFGPDPTRGELCYASRTFARASLDDVEPRPHRAVVRVVLRNKSPHPFELERLLLPVRHLGLYRKDGFVFTDDLFFVREGDDLEDNLELHESDWRRAPEGATRLCDPRDPPSRGLFDRVFSPLFARERTFS